MEITAQILENTPGSKEECRYLSAEEFLYSDDWAPLLIFIKTTDYKINIRRVGNLKPKVKSIVSSMNFALEKLEETDSEIPEILVFDLMRQFKLIFFHSDNEDSKAVIKIFILTCAEFNDLVSDNN